MSYSPSLFGDWVEKLDELSSLTSIPLEQDKTDTFLRDTQEQINILTQEEEQITNSFANLINPYMTKQDQLDLIEALSLEFKIRNKEKQSIVQKLMERDKEKSVRILQLERQLQSVNIELQDLRSVMERRSKRLAGNFIDPGAEIDVYDWVVDIGLLTDITKDGWIVEFSDKFWNSLEEDQKNQLLRSLETEEHKESNYLNTSFIDPELYERKTGPGAWEGAVVAVVGLYDKGKTFLLNNITESKLPSGKKVNTKGLSFRHVNMDSGTKLILLDTAGSYSPVKVVSEFSVAEKEATELFLLDLVFELSDYFIFVVNDFTSLDQRFLDKITRGLQYSSSKNFREVIVVHNLKEVDSVDVINHLWETQVTQIYGSGSVMKTRVAAINPTNNQLEEKDVSWFKTEFSRHICLANADSETGMNINPFAFSLLKYWLKAVFVPVNRPISVVETVISFTKLKLSSYFKYPVSVELQDGSHYLQKKIVCQNLSHAENPKIPQFTIDSSGFIMSRPDSFLPAVDIVQDGMYYIYMDIPGLSKEDIILSRQNVITIVQGKRKKPYSLEGESAVIKQERKYGDFAISFRIPEQYERRWSSFEVENGVLVIKYKRDQDEELK
jgi:HSP20 family molecular chaperone IbpA